MNPPTNFRALACALAVALANTPTRAEAPRGADWIAADAVAYLEIPRPSALLEGVTAGPIPGLLDGIPDYRKYLSSDAYRDHRAAVDAVAARLGTTWDKGLDGLLGGGVVLAIEPSSPPRTILIATPRDPAFLARAQETLLAMARDDAAAKGRPDPVASAEHRGIRGYALGPKGVHAIVDGALIVADSAGTLKAMIDRSIDPLGPGKSLAGDPLWQSRRRAHLDRNPSAWAFLRVDRLRQIDPNALKVPNQVNPLATILFADWLEGLRKAPWVSASVTLDGGRLGAELTLPTPPGGYPDALRRFLPDKGRGAPGPIMTKGMIASVALWRDLSSLWEVRADLFPPPVVQGFAQLDTFAGTFFGGRDFGTGVLGALGTDWRLVVARQDSSALDPRPDDKLPAFALIAALKPDDEDFAVRLQSAFQSFVGLANLGAAQSKAPPLMLGTETVDGVAITTARYLKPKAGVKPGEPVHARHNLSPSAARVGDHFVLGSSVGLVRDLIPALKAPATPGDATLRAEADGGELAALVEENRPRLVMQNMLEKGNEKARAEVEVDFLARLLRSLGRGSLSALDAPGEVRLKFDFETRKP